MTYSIRQRDGETRIGPDGTVVIEVEWRLFFNTDVLASGKRVRTILPTEDISTETSRAAKLAEAARKLANPERNVTVTTR